MYIAFAPNYVLPLPEGHRFPMQKYALIPEQLLYEGTAEPTHFHAPEPVAREHVLRAHQETYVERLLNLELTPQEVRRIGFPLTPELVKRELCIAQGTIRGCEYALEHGIALNVAGGTHHAYSDRGEGFCLLNDQAIAAHYLLATGQARRILIVDLDVHQGNGTAEIFRSVPEVFTFSMHGAANYPYHKEQSDLDIALPTGAGDAEYLQTLEQTLPKLIALHRPDFVFYLSGVDVLATDRLGKLALSPAGCKQRDAFVLEYCKDRGLPVQVSMGGGYSPRLADIVEAHCNTYRLAQGLFGG